jgi:uncharacterized DUF497 family protein
MALTFEWDEDKAKANLNKHQVSFEEARSVFNEPLAITIPDPEHSSDESRYIDIGLSSRGRTLVVVYAERRGNIRIISVREATRLERQRYEESDF